MFEWASKFEELHKYAKIHHFSYNGEIFSVQYMENLARFFLNNGYRIHVFHGELNSLETREHLMNGGLVLVPYDTDKNNSPGLYNGHKAHWAILCGAVETNDSFYMIARHGKARNVAIWKLTDLSISNMQLNEFSPDRKHSDLQYKIPEGGLSGDSGLKNGAVFIQEL
ncbi:UPF0692 protein CG33108 isoform X2 [Coccinella septempunctata]|uniref:UPF0692 protein CG33108 isoform X2 n=1 Tax=Coccinella septempunctata TaxID=41139 RepID=UPI001D06E2E7|nr:UPF0692 protein CG33108 isoform X2 [Coccinella septempunctata]